jgi:hypothetical protein
MCSLWYSVLVFGSFVYCRINDFRAHATSAVWVYAGIGVPTTCELKTKVGQVDVGDTRDIGKLGQRECQTAGSTADIEHAFTVQDRQIGSTMAQDGGSTDPSSAHRLLRLQSRR